RGLIQQVAMGCVRACGWGRIHERNPVGAGVGTGTHRCALMARTSSIFGPQKLRFATSAQRLVNHARQGLVNHEEQ
ncbi:hypothetical protein, partial [Bradyrhizobium sp.]|uniref:hypothetical protein n=1 Tax=Bradyrhizobium sp. TaxID=376 RepID=UPI0025BDBA7C